MSRRTVLIVDDAYSMRNLLRKALKEADYEVVSEAKNGKEGVEMYFRLKPDVVTMDIKMPEMSGIEATKQILAKDPQAKIIVVTGNSDDDIKKEIMDAGALEYLSKPFQPAFLWNKLDNVVKQTQAKQENPESPVNIITGDDIEDSFEDMEIEILTKPDESKNRVFVIENSEDNIIFPEDYPMDNKNIINEDNLKKYEEEHLERKDEERINTKITPPVRPPINRTPNYVSTPKSGQKEDYIELVVNEDTKQETSTFKSNISKNNYKPKREDLTPPSIQTTGGFTIRPPRGRVLRDDYDDDSDDIEEPILNESKKQIYNNNTKKSGLFSKVKNLFKK